MEEEMIMDILLDHGDLIIMIFTCQVTGKERVIITPPKPNDPDGRNQQSMNNIILPPTGMPHYRDIAILRNQGHLFWTKVIQGETTHREEVPHLDIPRPKESLPEKREKEGMQGRDEDPKEEESIRHKGIFNISGIELTKRALQVLDQGLKFAPKTPLNNFETYVGIQKFIRSINIMKHLKKKIR